MYREVSRRLLLLRPLKSFDKNTFLESHYHGLERCFCLKGKQMVKLKE